jgi:hypothetical protein
VKNLAFPLSPPIPTLRVNTKHPFHPCHEIRFGGSSSR